MRKTPILALTSVLILFTSQSQATGEVRQLVHNRGSDSMAIAVIAWAEVYEQLMSSARVSVSGGGSGTGIAALINGVVNIANASRHITEKEVKRARERNVEPVEHVVGHDAIAIYVHGDNPIRSLSEAQLTEIFADGGSAERWSDLGIQVPGCKDQKIVRVSRQSSSGTYAHIRRNLLDGKRFKLGTLEMQGSKDVVELVGSTPCSIGYSSYAYETPDVRAVCISTGAATECVSPSISVITDRSYPLSRPLFMYTNGQPTEAIKDYLDWILSDQGQCILLQKQYAPVRSITCGG